MKQMIRSAVVCGLIVASVSGNLLAQDEKDEGPEIFPVELYACSFHDGKGPADLQHWADMWNEWVDGQDATSYSAWTLMPFYYGENQDFDFLWLGAAPDAVSLGRAQDAWVSRSGDLPAEFARFASCGAHGNFAAMNIKQPPEDQAKSVVLSFSDCTVEDGKTWDDVGPVLAAWSDYRAANGSKSGMWVLWPAYGGGSVDFDFKFITSHRSYESLGVDYDQYTSGGYAKADELFNGVIDCDVSRSYNATLQRRGEDD
jgi:hypothetical protein